MDNRQYKIYQCENQTCGLRFPGYEGYPRWNLCPHCRSKTHVESLIKLLDGPIVEKDQPSILPVVVMLDNLRSALNVGSIFRSSDGLGIQEIYCCGITPTPDNQKVKKTALGAEVDLVWKYSPNGLISAKNLKSNGYLLWALENTSTAESLFHVDLQPHSFPLLLIVGNEISGVDPGIMEICDKVISIPMMGNKHSYNVSVAFAIAVSHILYRFLKIN